MRIKLSSSVPRSDIDFCEIASASNLNIVRSFKAVNLDQMTLLLGTKPHSQMRRFEGTLWKQPSASPSQGAIRDSNLFHVSYHAIWVRRPIDWWYVSCYWKRREQVFSYPQMQKSFTESTYTFWQSEVWLPAVPHLLVPVGQLQRSARGSEDVQRTVLILFGCRREVGRIICSSI
jgi:hypothetical protein